MIVLAGCAASRPAPVVDRLPTQPPAVTEAPAPAPEPPPPEKPIPTHTVKRGETLVGIALQYGLDYRELAAWNNIVNANVLNVGQVLVLAAPAGAKAVATVTTPLVSAGPPIEARPLANTPAMKVEPRGQKLAFSEKALAQLSTLEAARRRPRHPRKIQPHSPRAASATRPGAREARRNRSREDVDWMWPVKGKVLATFTEASKGMDIGGRKGAPVLAAAGGKIVYAARGCVATASSSSSSTTTRGFRRTRTTRSCW